jgi:hypothetical protein
VTVGISHYAEKVRWGLDIKRSDPAFDYVEDAHPPALASLFTTRLDPGCSATPIIELREGEKVSVMKDSTAILEHLCPFLYPEERLGEVREWEERLDRLLGTTSRVFAVSIPTPIAREAQEARSLAPRTCSLPEKQRPSHFVLSLF